MSRIPGIDAALLFNESRAYLFRGDRYVRYNAASGCAEPGYPRLIQTAWKGVPFHSGLDAAVNWGNGKAYLFKGSQYLRYDLESGCMEAGYPRPIASAWNGMTFTSGVDAVLNFGNGKAYFFKGNQYIRYDIKSGQADTGYPRPISSAWSGMVFTDGIDEALNLGKGKAYFFKGEHYIRYDIASGKADPGYPARCDQADRWRNVDFRELEHNGISTWKLREELQKYLTRATAAKNTVMIQRINRMLRPPTLEHITRNATALMNEAKWLNLTTNESNLFSNYVAAIEGVPTGPDPIFSGGGAGTGLLDASALWNSEDAPHDTALPNKYEGPELLPKDLRISDNVGCAAVTALAITLATPTGAGAAVLLAESASLFGTCQSILALSRELMR